MQTFRSKMDRTITASLLQYPKFHNDFLRYSANSLAKDNFCSSEVAKALQNRNILSTIEIKHVKTRPLHLLPQI